MDKTIQTTCRAMVKRKRSFQHPYIEVQLSHHGCLLCHFFPVPFLLSLQPLFIIAQCIHLRQGPRCSTPAPRKLVKSSAFYISYLKIKSSYSLAEIIHSILQTPCASWLPNQSLWYYMPPCMGKLKSVWVGCSTLELYVI